MPRRQRAERRVQPVNVSNCPGSTSALQSARADPGGPGEETAPQEPLRRAADRILPAADRGVIPSCTSRRKCRRCHAGSQPRGAGIIAVTAGAEPRVILVRKADGKLGYPKGGRDGQSVRVAAVREWVEETGLDPAGLQFPAQDGCWLDECAVGVRYLVARWTGVCAPGSWAPPDEDPDDPDPIVEAEWLSVSAVLAGGTRLRRERVGLLEQALNQLTSSPAVQPPAADRSAVQLGLDFGLKLVGVPYGWWTGGPIPEQAPMWAVDAPPPPPDVISSCNCTGLTNLMLRAGGRPLPFDPSVGRGGTGAYGVVFESVARPFRLEQSYSRGTLLIRRYRGVDDQGHVAVVLGEQGPAARVLQSHASNSYPEEHPGVNTSFTVRESHAGGYYELAVAPEDWIGIEGSAAELSE